MYCGWVVSVEIDGCASLPWGSGRWLGEETAAWCEDASVRIPDSAVADDLQVRIMARLKETSLRVSFEITWTSPV